MPFFVPVHPPRNPDECPAWLFDAISRLNRQATHSTQGLAAVVRGEAPDSSGNSLVDLSRFFVKPGLSGGQIGYGGVNANENLWLSSTLNVDKGFIYLGYPNIRVALDEDAGFLGIGTTAPSQLLHLNIASAGTVTTGATGTPWLRASIAGVTLWDLLPVQFSAGAYELAIRPVASGVQILASDGTAGLRLVPTGSRAYLQAGYLNSSGVPVSPFMTLGGIGATYGTNISVAFSQIFLDGNPYPKLGVGINPDPAIVTPWRGTMGIKASATTEPAITVVPFSATNLAQAFEMRKSVTTSFGARLVSMEYDSASHSSTGSGRLTFWGSDDSLRSGWITSDSTEFGGNAGKIVLYDRNSNRAMSWDSGGPMWTDSKTTTLIDLGASISAFNAVIFMGVDAGILDRFGLCSKGTLLTDQFIPAGTTVPAPRALVEIRNTVTNATVVLGITRKSGQTGDLTDWWDSDGTTKLAKMDTDGNLYVPGIPNAVVDEDGNVVTADGEIVFATF